MKLSLFLFKYFLNIYFMIFLMPLTVNSQHQWILGVGSNFNQGNDLITFDSNGTNPPVVQPLMDSITLYSVSSFSYDQNGTIDFITNGYKVFDKYGNWLNTTTYLSPSQNASPWYSIGAANHNSICMIQPAWDTTLIYILHSGIDVTISDPGYIPYRPIHLYYSVIDKTLNNGLGGLSVINQPIINDTLESGGLLIIQSANGVDWWIITKEYNSNNFYKTLLTEDGFNVLPNQQISNWPGTEFHGISHGSVNPDGSKLVLQSDFMEGVIMDFDNCNGDLSNPTMFSAIPDYPYEGFRSSVFSEQGRFLYVNTHTRILQYDMWASNIQQSQTTVAIYDSAVQCDNTYAYFLIMKRAPDGKIYISQKNKCPLLHQIHYPDSLGVSCNVIQNAITLNNINVSMPELPYPSAYDPNCDFGVGIYESDVNRDIWIYPNPTRDVVHIKNLKQTGIVELYNSTGRQIVTEKLVKQDLKLNLSVYSPGIYFLVFKNAIGEIFKTEKVVKL